MTFLSFLLFGVSTATGMDTPAARFSGPAVEVAARHGTTAMRSVVATGTDLALPGREADARVARIAGLLSTAGLARCPAREPASGIVWQHLSQFTLADRPALAASQSIDRGAEAIAVVPGEAGEAAGIRPGDVLLAVEGVPLPPEAGLTEAFNAVRAHARADAVDDLLARSGPIDVTLLRDGATVNARLSPRPACPSRVRLARSDQRNAFADGRHVFLTTGVMSLITSDDELAFVLAHEMAHNILGHAALLRAQGVGRGLGRTLGKSGALVRGTERAADALAGELMLDAGYDPVAGIEVLRRLGTVDLGIALFADHAPLGERVAAMRQVVETRRATGSAR